MNNHLSYDQFLLNTVDTGAPSTIISFLEKPFLVQTGNFQPTDTGTTFTALETPKHLLNNAVFKDKLNGFLSFRADIVYRLVINGTRFLQGRYILFWVPGGGSETNDTVYSNWYNMHAATLTQVTQLPHVEIDLACDTAAEFTVPYISAFPYYSLPTIGTARHFGNTGTINIRPYSTATSTVSYSLWANFKNITIHGPIVPQMGTQTDKEQKATKIAPLSSVLSKVSRAALTLGEIPLLSTIATPLGWAVHAAAGAALAMGFSAPLNAGTYGRMITSRFAYMNNVDAADQSFQLAYCSSNEVSVLPGFSGTDQDELSLASFFIKPAYIRSFTWSTAQSVGVQLFNMNVGTEALATLITDGTAVATNFTPAGFVMTQFAQYRGDFKLTFKIVKTEFHSGRLVVGFYPYDRSIYAPAAATLANSVYVHREILDIRTSNEFSVTIPWMSNCPYRATSGFENVIGSLVVFILDPLVAPPSVPSTITFLVEISMGGDTEVAMPRSFSLVPYVPNSPQMGDDNPCGLEDVYIGGAKRTPKTLAYAEACVGEKINNFRAILKQSQQLGFATKLSATMKSFSMYPFAAWAATNVGDARQWPEIAPDLYGLLSTVFCFSRGGSRIKCVLPTVGANDTAKAFIYTEPPSNVSATANQAVSFNIARPPTAFAIRNPCVYFSKAASAGVEVQFPQYCNVPMRANRDHMFTSNGPLPTSYTSMPKTTLYVDLVSDTPSAALYRSGSDDANFGLFISVPPMLDMGFLIVDQF